MIGGKTQFLIDMTGVAEYDHIDLRLTAKNFVAHARVEKPGRPAWPAVGALMADSILYDLFKRKSGWKRRPEAAAFHLQISAGHH